MTPRDYVMANMEITQAIKDRLPGDPRLDMYYGTLDYATARFNTILLKLSQDAVLEQELASDVKYCFDAIHSFYRNVLRYDRCPKPFKFVIGFVLHVIGTHKIPKIKRLLHKVNN